MPGYLEAKVERLRIVTLYGGWGKKTYPGIKLESTIVTYTRCPDGTTLASEAVCQARPTHWTYPTEKRVSARNFEKICEEALKEHGIPNEWQSVASELSNGELWGEV